jgi:hypothetical protein
LLRISERLPQAGQPFTNQHFGVAADVCRHRNDVAVAG